MDQMMELMKTMTKTLEDSLETKIKEATSIVIEEKLKIFEEKLLHEIEALGRRVLVTEKALEDDSFSTTASSMNDDGPSRKRRAMGGGARWAEKPADPLLAR